MSCDVLTEAQLVRLLAGTLTAPEQATLSAHLATPCEACLDLLASADAERLLGALAGPGAQLSAEEADRMFEAALPRAQPAPAALAEPAVGERLRRWLSARPWAPALLAAALVLLVLALRPRPAPYVGTKAAPGEAVALELFALRARPGPGGPTVLGPLADGDALAPGEQVLFRFRLGAPAQLYLVAVEGGVARPLWSPDPGEPPWPAGEHQLAQGGQALALDLAALGLHQPRLLAVASPEQLPGAARWASPERVRQDCPRCGLQALSVRAP